MWWTTALSILGGGGNNDEYLSKQTAMSQLQVKALADRKSDMLVGVILLIIVGGLIFFAVKK